MNLQSQTHAHLQMNRPPWFFFSHMVGAGLAAYGGGFFHDLLGDYHLMFVSAAILGFIAAGLSLGISPARKQQLAVAAT
ncbi:MAG TPA: hypothetical protein VGL99_23360 [Chloroflexota bacterium]